VDSLVWGKPYGIGWSFRHRYVSPHDT